MEHSRQETERIRNDEIEIDLRQLFGALRAKLPVILLAAVACAALAFGAAKLFITPMYRADFTAYVNNRSGGEDQTSLTSSDLSAARSLASTYAEIISGRSVLVESAKRVGLGDLSYKELSRLVTVETSSNTEIITVYVEGVTPESALYLAQSIQMVAEEQIASIVDGSSMRVVDQAVLPDGIYSPEYMKLSAVAFVLGAFMVVAIVVLMEIMDDRIKDEGSLEERFGYAIIGTIPNAAMAAKVNDSYGGYGQAPRKRGRQ